MFWGVFMKVAVIGSRNLTISNLGSYLPKETTELISGGARGIDRCARQHAHSNNLKFTEFLPEYAKYGRSAPLRRNEQIADRADLILAFWDGTSRGTKYTVDYARKAGKQVVSVLLTPEHL